MAEFIRNESKFGWLASEEEFFAIAVKSGHGYRDNSDTRRGPVSLQDKLLADYEDIECLTSDDGRSMYYSTGFMTARYAALVAGRNSPVVMAEIVRENSELYPRPVPLEFFMDDPLNLSMEQIGHFLDHISKNPEFDDICSIRTSTGRVFLYSRRGLDQDHADALAEWHDLGESRNP